MKAVVVRAFGHRCVTVGELPDPVPGPGEVLVDVEATEINYPDSWSWRAATR